MTPTPAVTRFRRHYVVTEAGCWQWTGALTGPGPRENKYPWFLGARGHSTRAHRWAYEQFVGPIPEGLDLDHLCRNRQCVNPTHLEPVTRRENLLRGDTVIAQNAAKTHCVRGHEFTPENTRIHQGARQCRECGRIGDRARYRKRDRAPRLWTRERIIDAIQRFAADHGRPPLQTEWVRADPENGYPAITSVVHSSSIGSSSPFAKWADAIEAAGFPRPRPGAYDRSVRERFISPGVAA